MKNTETHVYRDGDKLGRGEYYSYVSRGGNIVANFGNYIRNALTVAAITCLARPSSLL